jgi:hypothetical protein
MLGKKKIQRKTNCEGKNEIYCKTNKCSIFGMFEINQSFNIHVLKLPRYYDRAKIA